MYERRVSLRPGKMSDVFEEMIMVPKAEAQDIVDYYKGKLTSNALLEEAAQLAAKKQRILEDDSIPLPEAVRKSKNLSAKLFRATKQLRTINPNIMEAGTTTTAPLNEDDLVSTNVEKWLKRLAMGMDKQLKEQTKKPPRLLPATPAPAPAPIPAPPPPPPTPKVNQKRSQIPISTTKKRKSSTPISLDLDTTLPTLSDQEIQSLEKSIRKSMTTPSTSKIYTTPPSKPRSGPRRQIYPTSPSTPRSGPRRPVGRRLRNACASLLENLG